MKKLFLGLILVFLLFPLFAQERQVIHVMVALCDNKYQGIVKVPKGIGNGQDPNSNLYWGCGYGMRTMFRKSADWKEVRRDKVDSIRLERIVFKHKIKNYYLVADAYNGQYIKRCTEDFLNSCAGVKKDTLMVGSTILGLNGNARLVSYVGHNGLMDFKLSNIYQNKDGKQRDAIIIACASKQYFSPYLYAAKAKPLVWSTHLMSAEAYTVYDAVMAYINGQSDEQIREAAAAAYNRYQKCGIKAARRLLVTGF
ncbi:hypothetical protein JGH11_17725 [Dysgonomonas sp. Marseille-P4677]|uniref:hypothetical protein n=1 Tax=Dysgonomonas sp. Marseille-P4677 TaxID=2364790 RepID=UPI00191386A7|nr:hypothetical protein [Dysgonomonas sp. Marseille-P4677]MBK5722715.1 hypothetical protein [Dysgonomonas sp. Marseille-P4677]